MRLFATDIDGTIHDDDRPETGAAFVRFWEESLSDRLLVLNTGRSLGATRALIEERRIPRPDFVICAVGTRIFDWRRQAEIDLFPRSFTDKWDRRAVIDTVDGHPATERAELQPDHDQGEHKASWYWHDASEADLAGVLAALGDRDIEAQAVYSSERDLDILPLGANKGNAVAWLRDHLGLGAGDVAVAGDSGNDVAMFLVPDVHRILPSNAEAPLVAALDRVGLPYFRASRPSGFGTVDGLRRILDQEGGRAG